MTIHLEWGTNVFSKFHGNPSYSCQVITKVIMIKANPSKKICVLIIQSGLRWWADRQTNIGIHRATLLAWLKTATLILFLFQFYMSFFLMVFLSAFVSPKIQSQSSVKAKRNNRRYGSFDCSFCIVYTVFLNNNVSICSAVLFAFHYFHSTYFQMIEPNYLSRSFCRFRSCVPTSLLDGETLGWLKRSQLLIFLFLMFLFLRWSGLYALWWVCYLCTVKNATARPMPPLLPHLVFCRQRHQSQLLDVIRWQEGLISSNKGPEQR